MMSFYQNERVKRRLMNEMMELQTSINIIEYPLELRSARPQKSKKKESLYRRYFN